MRKCLILPFTNDIIPSMREKFDKIVGSRFGVLADKFCNSFWYIVAIGAVCIVSHTFDIVIVGAALLTLLLVPALLFCKNSFTLAPFLMMCSFVMSEETMPQSGYYNSPSKIAVLCVFLVFIVAALVFNLVYYGKFKRIFKKGYLTVSICLMSGALVIGGLGASTFSLGGVGMSLAIAFCTFLPYSLMINCGEYKGRKTVEYFAFALIVSSVVIGAAVFDKYLQFGFETGFAMKGTLQLGYAISNTAAAIVILAIPFTFYFVYKYKLGYLFLLLVLLELGIILATYSRATLLVAVPGTVIVAIVLCFKKKTGRIGYFIVFGIAAAAALAFVIVFWDKIYGEIASLLSSGGPKDNGRFKLWRYGYNAWKQRPVFGVGLWYLVINKYRMPNPYYSFHCTPLTYLYCAGIVGLAAYLYHRYKTVRIVFSEKLTSERVFVALAVLAMIVNALLDIAMTMPPHLLYYSMMLALIECDVKKTKADKEISAEPDTENIAVCAKADGAADTAIDNYDTTEDLS